MRFRVLACDFDNTLATHGVTTDAAVSALRDVAASGRSLVLVTGRVLEEILDVFAELDVFDRVILENGGLLYDPATGGHRLLGPPVPAELVSDLRDAGVQPLIVGRVICASLEQAAAKIKDAIRRLQLDRQLIYNKGSLMVLPAGVDKASGLRAALDDLGENAEATVAVGDAENDIVLLDVAGAGVAVANAIDSVKEQADVVLERSNGEGVRVLCRALVEHDLANLLPNQPSEEPAWRVGQR
jgi:hydroxymethylpyrimidine pyrophosphatase-like HAD family hydrolase